MVVSSDIDVVEVTNDGILVVLVRGSMVSGVCVVVASVSISSVAKVTILVSSSIGSFVTPVVTSDASVVVISA